jgi:hypothetical protein
MVGLEWTAAFKEEKPSGERTPSEVERGGQEGHSPGEGAFGKLLVVEQAHVEARILVSDAPKRSGDGA